MLDRFVHWPTPVAKGSAPYPYEARRLLPHSAWLKSQSRTGLSTLSSEARYVRTELDPNRRSCERRTKIVAPSTDAFDNTHSSMAEEEVRLTEIMEWFTGRFGLPLYRPLLRLLSQPLEIRHHCFCWTASF
jgi:hypothetical protein